MAEHILESYFVENRAKYFSPDMEGCYCIGNKDICSHLEDEGATRFAWGAEPKREDFASIKKLYFLPSKTQIKNSEIPFYVCQLDNLRHLTIPFPFLLNLTQESLPNNIKCLAIENQYDYGDWLNEKKILWPEITLSTLKTLVFGGDYEPSTMWHCLGIENKHLSSLEFIKTYVDKEGCILNAIQKFEALKVLEIGKVYGHDIFKYISKELIAIEISGASAKFPFSNIKNLKKIEMIRLVGIKSEIDFEVFLDLPALTEVEIISSKKIKNINFLLKCKHLKSVSLLDCGNPLKKEGKQRFMDHGFQRLDIDFS